ncbi:hypothetical protein GS636_20720 [Ruegeria sp. HKCCD4884]|uniref:hypothetical protein n=1 Tax=Ruegeria sp. HKCCD4884 TaxID=2683022 RepID=UPI00149121B6|nr:hypothetical protein [Ruegeria sp. HKCCD4884]NOD95228.1 hypothetical protein [Ruegeria sp. HKCCD4884]
MRIWTKAALLLLLASPAHAYIGPGAGLGALFTLIAIILGAVLLIVGFLWYPIKRALRKRKNGELKGEEVDAQR